ncbi:putative membrane transport protein [Piscinibacter sakaiensis]|uniref:Putative membrane transport protein n=1 Tax=Piscinibacter sakaiensis TaxID=1547922 RepID=A0A0K8NYI2_PISS1|nr:putative membrane transport protein [Piscinibacter sakaiensis]
MGGGPTASQPATSAPADPTPVIVALSLAASGSGMSLRLADALLPRLAREFGIGLGQASEVVTIFAIAYGCSQIFFGPLGDRYGKLRVIAAAAAVAALGSLLCAASSSHAGLLAARLATGLGAAGIIPLAMAWIGDNVAYERRQPVLARFLIGQMAGFAAGVWLGGYAAEHLDWRTPFAVVAALFAVTALLVWRQHRRLPPGPAAPRAGGSALRHVLAEFRAIWAVRWARVVLVTVFLEGAALYGPFAFLASHLHLRFGLPLSAVGAQVMLFAAGGLGFALGAQALVPRLGEHRLVRFGAGGMALALLVLAFAPHWAWSLPACALLGLGFYAMHNTLQTHATQMVPQRRGTAVSAFASSLFLGQSVGVALCGLLVDALGTGALIAAAAPALWLIGLAFNRRRARHVATLAATPA